MMNPLEAMMLARKANQSGGLGVQSQGAQQMTPLLQQAQMNVASPQKMEAQPARLMEMDKYKYVNAAQDRSQANKELLFRTMESRANRASNESLAAQAHQQALQLEGLRQQNVMDAQDRAKRLDLENHKTKLDIELEEKKKQSEILQALNDERYEPLRKPIANTFATYNRWIGSGEGSRSEQKKRLMKDRMTRQAKLSVDQQSVQDYYTRNAQRLGYTPGSKIDTKSPVYDQVITQLFTQNNPDQAGQVLQIIETELGQVDKQIYSAYNTSLQQVGKLGISLPEADPYSAPVANQSPLQVKNINALPPKVDIDGGAKDGVGTGGGDNVLTRPYDPNSLLYNSQTGEPGFITQMAKDGYGAVSGLLPEAETMAKAGLTGGLGYGAYKLMNGGDKGIRMNASDYFDENLNRDGKPREKTTKVKPRSPLKPSEFQKLAGEARDIEKKLKNKSLSTAEKTRLQKDLNKVNGKLDDASPTYKKTKVPTQLTDQQFAQRKVKVFKNAVDKFGKGESKLTPTEIKNMTPDQMSKHISKLDDGFLKKWGGKLKNSIYLKDDKGDVIKDKNGNPRAFREIPKSLKLGAAATFGMIAWDYMTAMPAGEKQKAIEEMSKDAQLINEVRGMVAEEMQAEVDQNNSVDINGLNFTIR